MKGHKNKKKDLITPSIQKKKQKLNFIEQPPYVLWNLELLLQ